MPDGTVRGTLTFFLVFFLFQNEHMMVEKLLKLFICEVDAKLFKSIEFENFKTSNIKNTNEEVTWEISCQGSVDNVHKPFEETFVTGLCDCTKTIVDLFNSLTLDNIFGTDFDSWRTQGFCIFSTGNTFFGSTTVQSATRAHRTS